MTLQFSIIEHDSPRYHETRELRDAVLRRPLGVSDSIGEPETEAAHFHLAIVVKNQLIACLVLVPQENQTIKMRQVAVADEFRNRGIGAQLVQFAENFARERGFKHVMLYARVAAMRFYKRLGYAAVGEEFIEVTLPHRKMEKTL